MKKVILVDGNNLLFRSYYATAYQGVIMRNSKGFPTNALYGFINMMNKIMKEEEPSYILVAFDKGKTFRHDQYDWYKAGRVEMPNDLKLQFPKAKEVLDAMGIKHFEIDNYEADDIIGTVAKIVDEEDEFIATIISSDKDLLQLISDEVEVKLLKTSGFIRMTRDEFKNTYGGIEPINMIDLKALMGDKSDNIPGVKGIGEKTAVNLLSKYKTLDGVYQNIDDISGKTKEKLLADKDNAYMSYDIATIYREVPLDFTLNELEYTGFDKERFLGILHELEFFSLLRKMNVYDDEPSIINSQSKDEFEFADITDFPKNKEFSYYVETDFESYNKGKIIGVGLYDGSKAYYIPGDKVTEYSELFSTIYNKYTYDLKRNIVLFNKIGVKEKNTVFDLMIAAYLLNYTIKDDISFLAKYFDYNIPLYEDIYGCIYRYY